MPEAPTSRWPWIIAIGIVLVAIVVVLFTWGSDTLFPPDAPQATQSQTLAKSSGQPPAKADQTTSAQSPAQPAGQAVNPEAEKSDATVAPPPPQPLPDGAKVVKIITPSDSGQTGQTSIQSPTGGNVETTTIRPETPSNDTGIAQAVKPKITTPVRKSTGSDSSGKGTAGNQQPGQSTGPKGEVVIIKPQIYPSGQKPPEPPANLPPANLPPGSSTLAGSADQAKNAQPGAVAVSKPASSGQGGAVAGSESGARQPQAGSQADSANNAVQASKGKAGSLLPPSQRGAKSSQAGSGQSEAETGSGGKASAQGTKTASGSDKAGTGESSAATKQAAEKAAQEEEQLKKARIVWADPKVTTKPAGSSVPVPQPDSILEARKKPYGIQNSLDVVVRSDEIIELAGVRIPVAELERQMVVEQRGQVLVKPLDRPAQISAWGVYLVRKGDNLWGVHYELLSEYLASKGVKLPPHADRPLPSGRSSGVGKILKFAENMVGVYNIKTGAMHGDLDRIDPGEKVVVYNLTEIFEQLSKIDPHDLSGIEYDGRVLFFPKTKQGIKAPATNDNG